MKSSEQLRGTLDLKAGLIQVCKEYQQQVKWFKLSRQLKNDHYQICQVVIDALETHHASHWPFIAIAFKQYLIERNSDKLLTALKKTLEEHIPEPGQLTIKLSRLYDYYRKQLEKRDPEHIKAAIKAQIDMLKKQLSEGVNPSSSSEAVLTATALLDQPIAEQEIHLKLLVLGGSHVGKSSLTKHYLRSTFSIYPIYYDGSQTKALKIAGHDIVLSFDESSSYNSQAVKGIDALLICFDTQQKDSINKLKAEVTEILSSEKNADGERPQLFLVGTKADKHGLESKTKMCEEAKQFAIEHGLPEPRYTSAQDSVGINELFEAIITHSLDSLSQNVHRRCGMK